MRKIQSRQGQALCGGKTKDTEHKTEVYTVYKQNLFHHGDSQAEEEVIQRGCTVCL